MGVWSKLLNFQQTFKSWEISSVFVFQLETVCPQSVTVQYSKASLHHLSQTTPVFIRVPGPKLVFHPSHFALFALFGLELLIIAFFQNISRPCSHIINKLLQIESNCLTFCRFCLYEKILLLYPLWKKRSWYCSRHYVIPGLSNGWRRWISLVCSS